jgi:hypothetical protein
MEMAFAMNTNQNGLYKLCYIMHMDGNRKGVLRAVAFFVITLGNMRSYALFICDHGPDDTEFIEVAMRYAMLI